MLFSECVVYATPTLLKSGYGPAILHPGGSFFVSDVSVSIPVAREASIMFLEAHSYPVFEVIIISVLLPLLMNFHIQYH